MGKAETVPKELYDALEWRNKEQYDALEKRYDELLARYHELVLELGKRNPPPPEPVDIKYEDPTENFPVPDTVLKAIHTYSEPESVDALTTQEVCFGMLRRGDSEDDVIAAVHQGEDVET